MKSYRTFNIFLLKVNPACASYLLNCKRQKTTLPSLYIRHLQLSIKLLKIKTGQWYVKFFLLLMCEVFYAYSNVFNIRQNKNCNYALTSIYLFASSFGKWTRIIIFFAPQNVFLLDRLPRNQNYWVASWMWGMSSYNINMPAICTHM